MKTIGLAAIAIVAALVLGFGARLSAPTAHAATTGMAVIGCEMIVSDGNASGNVANAITGAEACTGGLTLTPAQITKVANNIHKDDLDSALTLADVQTLALSANKLTAPAVVGNDLLVFVFTDNEAPVLFNAPNGVQFSPNDGGGSNDWNCNTNAMDADCNNVPSNDGDGVVVARLQNVTAAAGDAPVITVSQDAVDQTATINIVGPAHNVNLTLVKSTIQAAASSTAVGTCVSDSDVTDASLATGVSTTDAVSEVTDADGTKLARVPVTLSSGTTSVAKLATGHSALSDVVVSNSGISLDEGTLGIASFAVICANTTTGTSTIKASINPGATLDTSTADLTVTGAPASIALTASPAQIACDGSQTSTVTAKVTDSAGSNVADGVSVNFSVVALGTANPINVKTKAGEASSTITPLSGASAGVTVIVTSGDAQASIRVDCSLPVATPTSAAPAATATPPGGVIVGPSTGNGGYLAQNGSAGFPLWTLVALALGSVVLVGGGLVTRRSGK